MSLESAIEREEKNGHAEFPEIEEGCQLLSELESWLVERYPGRVLSWRLQCAKVSIERSGQKNHTEIILAAEAQIQTYADLMLEEKQLLFPVIEGRRVLVFPRLPALPEPGSVLIAGWHFGDYYHTLRERGGLLRLTLKLITNREIWTSPEIRLDTNLSQMRPDGISMVLADISNTTVWSGGLENGVARTVVKTVAPIIDRKIGSIRFVK